MLGAGSRRRMLMEAFGVFHRRWFSVVLTMDRVAAVGVPLGDAPPRRRRLKHITRVDGDARGAGGAQGGRGYGRGGFRWGAELQMGEN